MSHDPRFSIIPGWIVTDPRLKGRDLQVLCLLGRHTSKKSGWCRRSQVKMAGELACARSTVQASLDRLTDMGVVEKHEEQSRDGRDSAHWYRVIYDRAPPSGYAFDAWQDDDEEENIPISEDNSATPPADISAPPADPGSAPPAGSGAAPINVSYLTPPAERREREGASEREEEERHVENAEPKKNRAALERSLLQWWATWPNYPTGSRTKTYEAWFALTDEERADCIARTPDYIAKVGRLKKDYVFAHVYLSERGWQLVSAQPLPEERPKPVAPFGKAWIANWMRIAAQPPVALGRLPPAAEQVIALHPEKAQMMMDDHRLQNGWPKLNDIRTKLREGKPLFVSPEVIALGSDFEPVRHGSEIEAAWDRLFARLKVPWLPEKRPDWLHLPAVNTDEGDIDHAVSAAFEAFKRRIEGNVSAAAE
jgi:DNA-binding transcriptional ArsR family regulator